MTPAPIRPRFWSIWPHFVHFVTKTKVAPKVVDPVATQVERERGAVFAENLSMSVLSRAWQILVKGVEEVKDSPRPLAAADMVLVRLAYAADLPTPEEALKKFVGAPSQRVAARAFRARPLRPRRGPRRSLRAAHCHRRRAKRAAPAPDAAADGRDQ